MCKYEPEISIITPVYNVANYLNRCINSIVNQTFENFELILIDDGSTDGSSTLCDVWGKKDYRIKVIHQKNQGAGAARNTGLLQAKGRYIGFVDSDDWIEPDMYRILHEMLVNEPNAEIAMCETNWTDQYKKPIKKITNYNIKVKSQNEMLKTFFRINGEESNYGIYTKLIKRSVLENFYFLEGTISEDVMACYDFFINSKYVVCIDCKLYNYFQNRNGVTKKKVTEKDFEYIYAFERIMKEVASKYPELSGYAKINYLRSNFTILSKMRIFGFNKKDPYMVEKYKELKGIVRKNFEILLKWKMPFSRKLLLIYVCL